MTGTQAYRLRKLIAALIEADRDLVLRLRGASKQDVAQLILHGCAEQAAVDLADAKLTKYIDHLTTTRV